MNALAAWWPLLAYAVVPTFTEWQSRALLPGVDYRGGGGYVVAPPSRTPLGLYRWVDAPVFLGGAK